jgi:TetR/AcrR family transcriptional regulator, transcriptional repressor for nem operon
VKRRDCIHHKGFANQNVIVAIWYLTDESIFHRVSTMGRERQFSESQVVDTATDLFVEHGYQGTSLAMLQSATGLGKQSLYNSFGDKRALYLQALDCAAARFAAVQRGMQAATNGRAAIGRFFDALVGHCASADAAERGCIVSSGLLEGIEDHLVRDRLLAKWNTSRELLRAAVERGQKDRSIANALPSAALADLLMSLMSGLRVSARSDFDAARLKQVASLGLSILDHR